MFTIRLIPTGEYNAKEVAQATQRWLDGSVGIAEKTPELALMRAREALDCPEHKDELGKWYKMEAVQICPVCGGGDICKGSPDVYNFGVSIPHECEGCGATWENEYEFKQTFNLEK